MNIVEYGSISHLPRLTAGYTKRNVKEFSRKTQEVFDILAIQSTYKIIGTASIKDVDFFGDIDLMSIASVNIDEIEMYFKQRFEIASKSEWIYILDLKCGEYRGIPVRWNAQSMEAGYQVIRGKHITFRECILMKSTVKIDVIAFIDKAFTEFSNNYYLTVRSAGKVYTTYTADKMHLPTLITELTRDAQQNYVDKKYFKFLRRVYSLLRLKNEEPNTQKLLVDYFNSNIGILNKIRNDLEAMLRLLDDGSKIPSIEQLTKSINTSYQTLLKIDNLFLIESVREWLYTASKQTDVSKIGEMLRVIVDYLQRKIDFQTERFIQENKNVLVY
jgi:hypothetical protein